MIKQFRWQGKQRRMGPVVLYEFRDLQRQNPKFITATDDFSSDFTAPKQILPYHPPAFSFSEAAEELY